MKNINVIIGRYGNTSRYKIIVLKGDIPLSSQIIYPNTKYVVRYDFDLKGTDITIPDDCILDFDGGTITNGTINCQNTKLTGNFDKDKEGMAVLTGSFEDYTLDEFKDNLNGISEEVSGITDSVASIDSEIDDLHSEINEIKNNVVEGYYYDGNFYEDSAHTLLIVPRTNTIYSDIPTNISYLYTGSHYVQLSSTIAPDEEDLTVENSKIKFKDKDYNTSNFSGLGKIYLRKNLSGSDNKLTQNMLSKSNTEYIIQYDYTLDSNITIPDNCTLKFDGGSLNGGTIICNNTIIDYTDKKEIENTNIKGSFKYKNSLLAPSNIDFLMEHENMLDNPFFKSSDLWTVTDCTIDGKLNISGVGYASQTKQLLGGHRYLIACYASVKTVSHVTKKSSYSYWGRYGLGFRVRDDEVKNGSYKLNVDWVANREVDDFIPVIYVLDVYEDTIPTLSFGEIYDGNGTLTGEILHAGLYDITDLMKGIPNYKKLYFAYKKYVERSLQYTSSYQDMKYPDTMADDAFREEENSKAKFLYMNNTVFETPQGNGNYLDKYNGTVTYKTIIDPLYTIPNNFLVANTGNIYQTTGGSMVYVYNNLNPKNKYFVNNIHTGGINTAWCYFYDHVVVYPREGATELSADWLSTEEGGAALTPSTTKVYELVTASDNYSAGILFRWSNNSSAYYVTDTPNAYTYTTFMDKPRYYDMYGVRYDQRIDFDDPVYLSIPTSAKLVKVVGSRNYEPAQLICLSEAPINETSVRMDSTYDSKAFRLRNAFTSARDLCILNGIAATDRKVQEIWNTQGTDLVMLKEGEISDSYNNVQMARADTFFNQKYYTIYGKGGSGTSQTVDGVTYTREIGHALCCKDRSNDRWFSCCVERTQVLEPYYNRVTTLPSDSELAAALQANEPDIYNAIAALGEGEYYKVTNAVLETYYPETYAKKWINTNFYRIFDQLIGWYQEKEGYDKYGPDPNNQYDFDPNTVIDWNSCAVTEIFPDVAYTFNEMEGYRREAPNQYYTNLIKKYSVVRGKKIDMAFKPFSMAKTMTVLTALQYLNLSDYIEYKQGGLETGSGYSYKIGEYFALRECIVFLLAASDNSMSANVGNQVGQKILEARYGK